MSGCKSLRLQSARAVAIVESVKELTNELTVAISRDEYMNKFCFHGVITDRAKNVEYVKEKYMAAAEELENLMGQLESAKKQLNDINLQYHNLVEENRSLENTIQSIKSGDYICNNEQRGFNNSRLKLKLYKMMTGVYFDLDNSNVKLSGIIAIKGDAKHPSSLITFTFNKEEYAPLFLWEKIGKVLHSGKECVLDSTAKQFKEKLEIK